jgi:SSS family transporter
LNIHPVDLVIILLYLLLITFIGIRLSGRMSSSRDYFLSSYGLPWWGASLSIVATETSTLTFISLPGIAYVGNLNFLQLGVGYIIGRIIVSFLFLPAYFRGNLSTSYELLHEKFGMDVRTFSSIIFLFTRLLADGVRLFATAIPLSLMTGWSLSICIIIIALATIIYTVIGGIRSVVWIDVIQSFIYIGGAIVTMFFVLHVLPNGWQSVVDAAAPQHKFQFFNFGLDQSVAEFFKINYTLAASLIGGAFLSMASHGTDQIIVQRLLICKSTRDGQKALIASGVLVFFQFAIFLVLGLMLFAFYHGLPMRSDEILPRFILSEMPVGLPGLIIAAVFAAAMSTLSSSLNSLASSTMFDLFLTRRTVEPKRELLLSRLFTIMWGLIFIGGAMIFRDKENPVVELGLAISSFTYGSVLGTFFLARSKLAPSPDIILVSMWSTIVFMTWFIGPPFGVQIILSLALGLTGIWIYLKVQSLSLRLVQIIILLFGIFLFLLITSPQIAWPWYVPLGTGMMFLQGYILSLFIKSEGK